MEDLTPLAQRIRTLMDEKGFNALSLAKAAKLGDRAIYNIFDGKSASPREVTVRAIAEALGVSAAYLMTGRDEVRPQVQIVGTVSAGEGWAPVDGDGADELDFFIGGGEVVAVRVSGTSMGEAYRDGDTLIGRKRVGKSITELINHDCIVMTVDGRAFVKTLKKGDKPGVFTLRSYNRAFDDIPNIALSWVAPIEWVKRR
jgi:phage repressor protein C with HTH and peptisase S24 domain